VTAFVVRTANGGAYPVLVVSKLEPALSTLISELAPSGVLLVTDRNVAALHLDPVRAVLGDATVEVTEPGEDSKSPGGLARLWAACRDAGLDRDGLVVALGGGVVGDLAGLAAATYMRGVRVVHLPTTLLAQVDSAIGGKTAINLGAKNLVGAFHQPAGVIADVSVLATLPPREVRSGLGEVWKTGILAGEPLLTQLETDAQALVGLDPDALTPTIVACLQHKAQVVARDEREAGERALLNLGHTLGHAAEVALGVSHGEAVAIGGVFACRLAQRLGRLDAAHADRFEALAAALTLPTRPAAPLDADALWALIARDKKARAGRVRWVLPRGDRGAEVHCEVTGDVQTSDVRALLTELGWVGST
jgi:3-dehydroquinate synthase